jgi:hypothetical protein
MAICFVERVDDISETAYLVQTHDHDLRAFSVREVDVSIEPWDKSARGYEDIREKILHP